MKKSIKKLRKGFTLVELVVVIAILAVLAAVSVGSYFGITASANKRAAQSEATEIRTVIQTSAVSGETDISIVPAVDGGTIGVTVPQHIAIDANYDGTDIACLTAVIEASGFKIASGSIVEAGDTTTEDDNVIYAVKYTKGSYSYVIDFSDFTVSEATATN